MLPTFTGIYSCTKLPENILDMLKDFIGRATIHTIWSVFRKLSYLLLNLCSAIYSVFFSEGMLRNMHVHRLLTFFQPKPIYIFCQPQALQQQLKHAFRTGSVLHDATELCFIIVAITNNGWTLSKCFCQAQEDLWSKCPWKY